MNLAGFDPADKFSMICRRFSFLFERVATVLVSCSLKSVKFFIISLLETATNARLSSALVIGCVIYFECIILLGPDKSEM